MQSNLMQGKKVLITGGNSGIGLVAAKALAQQGAELMLACRDSQKTTAALADLNGLAATEVVNFPVELASLASVRALAQAYQARHDRLDVLINNAGVFPPQEQFTEDGFEMQIGVNHFAPFLLTNLLLPQLQGSTPSRVVTVSSTLHKRAPLILHRSRVFRSTTHRWPMHSRSSPTCCSRWSWPNAWPAPGNFERAAPRRSRNGYCARYALAHP